MKKTRKRRILRTGMKKGKKDHWKGKRKRNRGILRTRVIGKEKGDAVYWRKRETEKYKAMDYVERNSIELKKEREEEDQKEEEDMLWEKKRRGKLCKHRLRRGRRQYWRKGGKGGGIRRYEFTRLQRKYLSGGWAPGNLGALKQDTGMGLGTSGHHWGRAEVSVLVGGKGDVDWRQGRTGRARTGKLLFFSNFFIIFSLLFFSFLWVFHFPVHPLPFFLILFFPLLSSLLPGGHWREVKLTHPLKSHVI